MGFPFGAVVLGVSVEEESRVFVRFFETQMPLFLKLTQQSQREVWKMIVPNNSNRVYLKILSPFIIINIRPPDIPVSAYPWSEFLLKGAGMMKRRLRKFHNTALQGLEDEAKTLEGTAGRIGASIAPLDSVTARR